MGLNKAYIVAGGFGTRMKEFTRSTPKPMLPLQGKPILEYSIDLCKMHGINDIAISVLYLGDMIRNYFRNGAEFGVRIQYIAEHKPLGTAGGLRLASDFLDETFVMCNADELKDIDLHEMYRQHKNSGALATIALTEVSNPSNYGVAELHDNKITRFVEKPTLSEAPSNFINSGLYILEPEVIDYVGKGHSMIEKDVFPKLAAQGMLHGFKFDGQWFDTGTKERYMLTEQLWKGFAPKMLVANLDAKASKAAV